MTVATFNPVLDGIAGGGSDTSWALARSDAGSSSGYTYHSQALLGRAARNTGEAKLYWIWRSILVFDTSSLPDNAVIQSAKLKLYVQSKNSGAGGGAALVAATPASDSALANGDFANLGSTRLADTDLSYSGLTTSAFNEFALNATGLAAISKTDKTRLGVRPSLDLDNSSPANGTFSDATCSTDNNATSAQWPVLEVTYVTASLTGGDTVTLTDTAARSALAFTRTGADTVTLSDSAGKKTPRTGGDALAFSDAGTRGVTRLVTVRVYPAYDAQQGNQGASWGTLRSASAGTFVDDTSNNLTMARAADNGGGTLGLSRGAFIFDLAAIVASWQVQAVTLNAYLTGVSSGAGGSVGVTAATWSNPTTTSEFGNVTGTEYATRRNFSALTANQFNAWTFTAGGVSAVQSALGGTFKAALRSSQDIDNSAPGSGLASAIDMRSIRWSGTASDPYLDVTVLAVSEPGGDTLTLNDGAGYDRGTAHGRPGYDTLTLTDTAGGYRRSRTPVVVVDEGANTTTTSSQNPSGGTITVASTTGFPASGDAYIIDTSNEAASYPQARFTYTSKDATHFYGCSSTSSEFNQTFASGAAVSVLDAESHFPQINVLDSTATPELLVTYHQHAAHSAANGRVMGRRSLDGGKTWGDQFLITESVGAAGGVTGRRPGIYGHTMVRLSDGKLFLSWYEHKLDFHDVETYTRYSTDNGRTWSAAVKVPDQFGSNLQGQGTGCGIIEVGGDIYMAVYGWEGSTSYLRTPDDAFVKLIKTSDLGQTWTSVAQIIKGGVNGAPVRGFNETSIVIHPDGTWIAQHRAEINTGTGQNTLDRYQTVSTDQGLTWSTPVKVIAGMANTPILHRMPDGTMLSQGMNAGTRGSLATGDPVTHFTPDYNNWPSTYWRAESIDGTYTQANGSCFRTVDNPASGERRVVNAYAMERSNQAGAQVRFQWYSIPGFYPTFDTLTLSDSGDRAPISRSRTGGDTVTITDSPSWSRIPFQRTGADTLTLSDAATRTSTRGRTGGDTLTLTDAGVGSFTPGGVSYTRTGGDTLSLSDAATRSSSTGKARIVYDTYVTSEQFGARTVSSDMFGSRTSDIADHSTEVLVHTETSIS